MFWHLFSIASDSGVVGPPPFVGFRGCFMIKASRYLWWCYVPMVVVPSSELYLLSTISYVFWLMPLLSPSHWCWSVPSGYVRLWSVIFPLLLIAHDASFFITICRSTRFARWTHSCHPQRRSVTISSLGILIMILQQEFCSTSIFSVCCV
jgi:hypothetical protein